MGLFSKLFSPKGPEPGLDVEELARRLKTSAEALRQVAVAYTALRIPKRHGGMRQLFAPHQPLKDLQRLILRRLLHRLASHPAATGFERGQSIATNAAPHVGADVVLKMDLRDFFTKTTEARIRAYFVKIGWGGQAADLLTKLTTYNGALPQGAPTSPRLSNLVNYGLDARLFALSLGLGAKYTRYADDMTFSFTCAADGPATGSSHRDGVAGAIQGVKLVLKDYGYVLHQDKKLQIRRRHDCMLVTGLVVNDRLNLPRATRRRLRAVRHHLAQGQSATLNESQMRGWEALEHMLAPYRIDPGCSPPSAG